MNIQVDLSDEMDIREKLLNKHEGRFNDIVSYGKEAQTLHFGVSYWWCRTCYVIWGAVLVSYHKTI